MSAKDSYSNSFPHRSKTTQAIDKAIGANIATIRKERNLSCEAVAMLMNVEESTYRAFEQGIERVRAADLFRLASVFDIPIQDFYRDIIG